jgi:hypothetical protein
MEPHRGGLDPLGPYSYEKKYIFSKSTEYQDVDRRNQTALSYIMLMLWRIMRGGEKFCI